MGESGVATGGGAGGGISKVCLALTVLLACLMAATFFYLQVSASAQNEALRARIAALDRRLAALTEAVIQINNNTNELIRKREEDQRRTYKEEEDVETDPEYEDEMDTEYDDPNEEDDSEYEEEEDYGQDKEGGVMNKEERRSKRSSGRSILSDEDDPRLRDRIKRKHLRSRRFQKMRRLRIGDKADMSAKQMDSIFEQEKYPVIQRNRRNNRREDVEVFTQNMTPLSSDLVAAHFGADETKCLNQPHLRHCDSNHKRYHPGGIIKDWNTIFTSSSTLNTREGKLTINSAGLYFVYAQVFYSNAHDVNSFRIIHNDQSIMQCTTYTNHNTNSAPRYSCFTGALAYLAEGDQLYVRDVEERRHTLFEKTKTFFGLFKVGNTLMV